MVRKSGDLLALGTSGFALGMFPGATFEPGTVRLETEDAAVLFTDGIPETLNEKREGYTEDRLRNLVAGYRELAAGELCRKTLEDVRSFTGGAEQSDDITLVVIKRSPTPGPSSAA